MLDWKHYKNTVKSNVLEGLFIAFMAKKRVNYRLFDWKHLEKHCQKQCFGRISYIYVGVGYRHWNMKKIEENTVNSGIFNGWGDKGIGSIVEHDVFDRLLWRQKCKVPCFEGNHCKNMETHSKNTGFGGLSRRRCLAI